MIAISTLPRGAFLSQRALGYISCPSGILFQCRINGQSRPWRVVGDRTVFQPPQELSVCAAARGGEYYSSKSGGSGITDAEMDKLRLGTALRNIGWLSFWSQLALTLVASVILLFSTGMTSQGTFAVSPMDGCTLIGAACGLITTFLSWTWIRAGRRLANLQNVKLQYCLGTVLASTNLNLLGMGATLLGLQATVGTLVGKTLTTSVGYYGSRVPLPPVALDVFSIQACANALMAHFAGILLGNWLLRVLQKYLAREEDRYLTPSAPPF